jgi:hypothetical protein
MMRRIAVLVVMAGLALVPVTMDPVQAVQPSVTIRATAVSTWTDAGTGVATFVASALPAGTAYLQWFNPGK